jgi:3-hydroxyacyl-[acyl-carrier-protein] dehydratase
MSNPTTRIAMQIADDHPAFAGHFPGQPLLPGVLLLAQVLEAALAEPALAGRLGDAPRLSSAKFLSPVRPGDRIEMSFDAISSARLGFEVRCGERLAASGQFESRTASA